VRRVRAAASYNVVNIKPINLFAPASSSRVYCVKKFNGRAKKKTTTTKKNPKGVGIKCIIFIYNNASMHYIYHCVILARDVMCDLEIAFSITIYFRLEMGNSRGTSVVVFFFRFWRYGFIFSTRNQLLYRNQQIRFKGRVILGAGSVAPTPVNMYF